MRPRFRNAKRRSQKPATISCSACKNPRGSRRAPDPFARVWLADELAVRRENFLLPPPPFHLWDKSNLSAYFQTLNLSPRLARCGTKRTFQIKK
ncbi:MAG: hypothetical protein DBX55_03790 [Verrucomicrobia bacterium]|nr:MAG: hypothetical protein DBX55_03790 [Verrucomicrobiota bacterium]